MSLRAKALLAAATDMRSLGVVVATAAATTYLWNPFIPLLGVGIYWAVTQKIIGTPEFQTQLRLTELIEEIKERHQTIHSLAGHSYSDAAARMSNEAHDLAAEFLEHPELDTPRQVLVIQALKLAEMYMRIREASDKLADRVADDREQMAMLTKRVNQKHQQLNNADSTRSAEIQRSLTMDEESCTRIQQRLDAHQHQEDKLQSLESAFTAACTQFYTPDIAIGGDNIEEALIEAQALYDAFANMQRPYGNS